MPARCAVLCCRAIVAAAVCCQAESFNKSVQQARASPRQAMALKAALVAATAAATVPSSVNCFCLLAPTLPGAKGPHPRYSASADHSSAPPIALASTAIFSGRWALLNKGRHAATPPNRASDARLMVGSPWDTPGSPSGRLLGLSGLRLGMKADNDRPRVSRALNRALGNILSAGDIFGGVGGKGISDGECRTQCSASNVQVDYQVQVELQQYYL